jgi:hypothetical protein
LRQALKRLHEPSFSVADNIEGQRANGTDGLALDSSVLTSQLVIGYDLVLPVKRSEEKAKKRGRSSITRNLISCYRAASSFLLRFSSRAASSFLRLGKDAAEIDVLLSQIAERPGIELPQGPLGVAARGR